MPSIRSEDFTQMVRIVQKFSDSLLRLCGEANPGNQMVKSIDEMSIVLSEALAALLESFVSIAFDSEDLSAALYTYSAELGFTNRAVVGPLSDYLRSNPPRLNGTAAYAMENRVNLIVPDVDDSAISSGIPMLSRTAEERGVKAFANIPLKLTTSGQELVIGTLMVNYSMPHEFGSDEVSLLQTFAELAADAIWNVEMYRKNIIERSQRDAQSESWMRIYDTFGKRPDLLALGERILEEARQFVSFDTASLQLIADGSRIQIAGLGFSADQDPPIWISRPIDEDAIVAEMVTSAKRVVVEDTREDTQFDFEEFPNVLSWAGIPLTYDQKVIGLIFLDHSVPNHYQNIESSAPYLESFAAYAARQRIDVHQEDNPRLRAGDLSAINRVSQSITSEMDVKKILQIVVEAVVQHLHCHACAYFEAEPSGDLTHSSLFLPISFYDVRFPEREMKRSFRSDKPSLVGYVFQLPEPLCLKNARTHDSFADSVSDLRSPLSMLLVPVKVDGKTIGVISADHDTYGWFDSHHERFVGELAKQAGRTIETAKRLDLVNSISSRVVKSQSAEEILDVLVEGAVNLTNTDAGVVYQLNNESLEVLDYRQYSRVNQPNWPAPNADTGITHKVVANKKSYLFPSLREESQVDEETKKLYSSSIAMPLVTMERVVGVLYLYSIEPRQFSESDESLLEILANSAAIGLENARRYELINNELAQMQDAAIKTSLAAVMVHNINSRIGTTPGWVEEIREIIQKPHIAVHDTDVFAISDFLTKIDYDVAQILELAEGIGKPVLKHVLDVRAILKSIRANALLSAPEDVDICLEMEDSLPSVYGVESAINGAIWQVTENAIQETPPGGQVTISANTDVSDDGIEWIHIDITDDGYGLRIGADEVFDLGRRSKNTRGLGFGLWYSKFNVESIGGHIEVLATGPEGTTFRISLPGNRS